MHGYNVCVPVAVNLRQYGNALRAELNGTGYVSPMPVHRREPPQGITCQFMSLTQQRAENAQ